MFISPARRPYVIVVLRTGRLVRFLCNTLHITTYLRDYWQTLRDVVERDVLEVAVNRQVLLWLKFYRNALLDLEDTEYDITVDI